MSMRLTAKSEYGLLAAIDLSCHFGEGPTSAREISEHRGIPPRFLEQLLVQLRRAGIVTALRGAHGGFELARNPRSISVLEVVEALDGPLSSSVCDAEAAGGCLKSSSCAASLVWGKATGALREVFASTTLAELAGEQRKMDVVPERASR